MAEEQIVEEVEEAPEQGVTDRMAALSEAFDADVAESEPEESVEAKIDEPAEPETVQEVGEVAESATQAESEAPEQQEVADEPVSLDTPPSSLPPDARAVWENTPNEMRAAIAKREADYYKGIKQATEKYKQYEGQARIAQDISQTLTPHQQLLNTMGGPKQGISNLLNTASMFQFGTQQQKAAAAANLIQQFGVDVSTLADVLESGPAAQQAPQQQQGISPQQIDQIIEQRLMAREQQEVGMSAQQQIQQFSSNPDNKYYSDVADTMANLLDVAARQGSEMSIQEAYDQACWANPQVRSAMQIERERQQAQESQQAVSQKRMAAGSISGSPSGTNSNKNLSRADMIREAMEMAGRT